MFFINPIISILRRILSKPFSLFIIFLCGAYFLLITQWHYTQMSDFKNYYEESLGFLVNGKFSNSFLFFQAPGHPYLMGLVFRLTNSTEISLIQFLNAGIYIFCIVLSHLSFEIKPLWLKYVGTISLSICVSYLSLMGYLAAEFHFLCYFVMGNFCLIKYLEAPISKQKILIVLIAFFFGIAQFVRPLSFYYLLFFGFGLFYLKVLRKKTLVFESKATLMQYVLVFMVFMFISLSLYKNATGKWAYQPTQNGLWTVYIGFNAKAQGIYNDADITEFRKIAEPLNWNGELLRERLKPKTIQRVKENWQENIRQSPQRAIRLLVLVPNFASYWFLLKSVPPSYNAVVLMKRLFMISTVLVVLSYLINGIYFIKLLTKRHLEPIEIFAFCALLSTFSYILIHLFCLEIQARYAAHLVFFNLWILPLSLKKLIQPNTKHNESF